MPYEVVAFLISVLSVYGIGIAASLDDPNLFCLCCLVTLLPLMCGAEDEDFD
jgi:hypothetical protein